MTTGELEFYNRLTAEVPEGVVDMLDIPDMGPKKAALVWKELGITSVDALYQAAKKGELRSLAGMGAKSEQKIIDGIEALARRVDRITIGDAYPIAQMFLTRLLEMEESLHGDIAGSLRRRKATIGDIESCQIQLE